MEQTPGRYPGCRARVTEPPPSSLSPVLPPSPPFSFSSQVFHFSLLHLDHPLTLDFPRERWAPMEGGRPYKKFVRVPYSVDEGLNVAGASIRDTCGEIEADVISISLQTSML